MPRYCFFLRVSTSKQSLESQYDDLLKFAQQHYDIRESDIVKIEYKESGRKLTEEERQGINDFKRYCDEGIKFDCVFVSEVSRIARTSSVVHSFTDYLKDHHIQLICQNPYFELLDEKTWEKTFTANLVLSIFSALAEQEIIEKRERFKRGKEKLAKDGKYNGGAIPYGYKKDPDQDNLIVINEDEAKIVREIYNLYEEGMSQPSIAKELFNRGIKGRAVKGTKKFTISLVHQILTNELLTGAEHLNKGSSYPRRYPAIITKEQFDRCRKVALENNTAQAKAPILHYGHRLIKCTTCGRYLISAGNKNNYHCHDAYNYNKKYYGYEGVPLCTNRLTISSNIVDSLLWELTIVCEVIFLMNESASKLKDLKDKREKLELKLQNIPSQLSELESRRDALFDALAEGMKKERFAVKKEELNKEERRIQLQRAEYEEGITRLDTLIEELTKGVSLVPQTDEEIAAVWSSYDTLTSKIREINDEMQRYDLIHKHIEYVTIEKVNVVNTFKYRGTKETPAKKIVVHFYMFSPRTFYFISCDGKGGHLVEESSPEEKLRTGEEYRPFPVEYLGKNYDEGKRTRREAHTRERKREEEKIATQMKQRGFISMGDMMRESGYSYSGLYRIISGGKMHGVKKCNKWFAPLNEFNDYMKTHNAKGKKISERDDWDGCTELLKAIEKVKNSQ